jgi:ornithine cyclodeaminase/alanine dehydrogenase-like protein (mu-crystallin family)
VSPPTIDERGELVIHLDEAGVERLCDLTSVTDRLVSAWRELAAGEAATTTRVRTAVGQVMASGMAAVLPSQGVLGGKLYAHRPDGFDFFVVLFSTEGGMLATFEANVLTAVRTAAATAVAVRYLHPPGASVATLFGTGAQSTWHALALHQELPLVELRICGRTPEAVDRLVDWARERGIPAVPVDDPDEAVRGSDVVATVTASYDPLFSGRALEPQALVCAVGATKADRRELDAETVRRAGLIVTDSIPGAKVEAGDLIAAAREGALEWDRVGDIMDVVAGGRPRTDDTGIVLFESQGFALQDVAAAALVYERCSAGAAG